MKKPKRKPAKEPQGSFRVDFVFRKQDCLCLITWEDGGYACSVYQITGNLMTFWRSSLPDALKHCQQSVRDYKKRSARKYWMDKAAECLANANKAL